MAKEEEKTEKGKDFETAMKNLKGFGHKASENEDLVFLSTGHLKLDIAIAHGVNIEENKNFDMSSIPVDKLGGFPFGKLVEVFGPEASGKSSLAYRIVGMAQKQNHKCFWIDTEQSFSFDLANINGVNIDELEYTNLIDKKNPDHIFSAEEIFDRITDICAAGYKVIVLDSVANLTTQAELDNYVSDGGVGMGQLASLLSKATKKVVQYAAKHGVLVIFINQIREKIGVMFGNPETTPGGKTLKFLSSIRIRVQKQLSKDGQILVTDDNGVEKLIGNYSYVKIEKNRFGKPVNGSLLVPVYYEPYFPDLPEIAFDTAKAFKVIRPRLGVFSWGDLKIEGRAAFINEIIEKNLVSKLIEDIKTSAKENNYMVPPEISNYKPVETAENAEIKKKKKKDSE